MTFVVKTKNKYSPQKTKCRLVEVDIFQHDLNKFLKFLVDKGIVLKATETILLKFF